MADGKGGNAARMAAQDEAGRLQRMGLLDGLPANKATGGDIIWAAGSYRELGGGYRWAKEATPEALVCPPSRLARRAEKKTPTHKPRKEFGLFGPGGTGETPCRIILDWDTGEAMEFSAGTMEKFAF